MTDAQDFDIRFSEEKDLSYLQDWFQDPKTADEFPFGNKEKEEALKNWIGFSKYKASLTGLIGEAPCAIGTLFLMPYKKVAHHCSFYLIVDPNYRKRGIGTSMVKNLAHLAKTRFRLEMLAAEIFEPSLILSILQKLQFREVFRQENFVKIQDRGRARIVMECEL